VPGLVRAGREIELGFQRGDGEAGSFIVWFSSRAAGAPFSGCRAVCALSPRQPPPRGERAVTYIENHNAINTPYRAAERAPIEETPTVLIAKHLSLLSALASPASKGAAFELNVSLR
jgi:hypothetical protein